MCSDRIAEREYLHTFLKSPKTSPGPQGKGGIIVEMTCIRMSEFDTRNGKDKAGPPFGAKTELF